MSKEQENKIAELEEQLSEYTMKLVIDKAIEKEKDYINKLIDMEIDKRVGGHNGNK